MKHQLLLKLNSCSGVLERVLRVIRHRGFEVSTLHVASNEQQTEMAVTVTGMRSIELLTRQLEKLFDVNHCQFEACTTGLQKVRSM